jgi:3-oxoadipate enol-lactonase
VPFIRVRDIEIYYELHGAGPRLLFIGGSGGDLRQKPGAGDGPLARHFELLAFDQRGLGQSGKADGPYEMSDYADDAAGLLDTLGWESAHVVGVSFGGMVAQHLALRHPQRVERLVLACTSSGGEGGASYPLHELEDLPDEERLLKSIELGDTRYDAQWREREPEAFAKMVAMMRSRGGVQAENAATEEDLEAARRGAHLQLDARSRHDTFAQLGGITAPTYVCGGRYDGIAPPSNLDAIATQIPGAELELFDGGHLFLLQDRSAFPRILDFLQRTESA